MRFWRQLACCDAWKRITTFSITTLRLMTFSMTINKMQHSTLWHSAKCYVECHLCWVSLCWVPLCWVSWRSWNHFLNFKIFIANHSLNSLIHLKMWIIALIKSSQKYHHFWATYSKKKRFGFKKVAQRVNFCQIMSHRMHMTPLLCVFMSHK